MSDVSQKSPVVDLQTDEPHTHGPALAITASSWVQLGPVNAHRHPKTPFSVRHTLFVFVFKVTRVCELE